MTKAILIKKNIGPENIIEETRIAIPTEKEKALLKETNASKGIREERIKSITKGLKEFGVSIRRIRVGDTVLEHCYIVPKIIGFVTFIITTEGGIKIKEVYLKTEKERNNKFLLNSAIFCFEKAGKIKEIKAIKNEINGLRKTELEFLSSEEKPYRISQKSAEELSLI